MLNKNVISRNDNAQKSFRKFNNYFNSGCLKINHIMV